MAGYGDTVVHEAIELVKAAIASNAGLALDAETLGKTLDVVAKKVHELHYIVQTPQIQR